MTHFTTQHNRNDLFDRAINSINSNNHSKPKEDNMKTDVDLRLLALQKAIKTLDAQGARYKIIGSDGAEYGNLTVQTPSARNFKYPRGAARSYYAPFLEGMKPNDTVSVPAGEFDVDTLQNGITAWCCMHWGNGSYFTKKDHENGVVVVLRAF